MNKRLACLFAVILVLLVQMPLAHSQTTPSAKDRALAFIEDVIQPDMSRYNVSLVNDIVNLYPPSPLATQESVTYFLSDNGIGPDINCIFSNNVLAIVSLSVDQAFVHSSNADQSEMLAYSNASTNLTEQTVGLLERYQNFTGDNLQDMTNALKNVDVTQNITQTSGDIKLETETTSLQTDVSLKYTYNNTDYTGIDFTFRNGQFYIFSDDRSEWTIGNTDVNINQTQAINIAQQYMKTYSYTLDDGTVVNQFNVTTINAALNFASRGNTTIIYPCWNMQVNLNDSFPPTVYAIQLEVWADSGQVFLAQPIAVGGGLAPPSSTSTATPNVPEFPSLAVILTLLLAVPMVILVTARKCFKTNHGQVKL
jgi:hypothetical protein